MGGPFVLPTMSDESKKALERLWTYNQREYMLYLSTPSEDRIPLTETAWAKERGISPATLWKWRQIPEFRQEVRKIIMDNLGDVFHDVTHSFKKEATKGSYQHQRMYFEMMGAYVERKDLNHSGSITSYIIEIGSEGDSTGPDSPTA